MLYWALVFLVVAIIAGALGFGGIAGTSAGIAQILFFIFLAFLVISLACRPFPAGADGHCSTNAGNRSPQTVSSAAGQRLRRGVPGGTCLRDPFSRMQPFSTKWIGSRAMSPRGGDKRDSRGARWIMHFAVS